VKVVFVELTNKAGKVGVFEESGKDNFCEFGHVFDDEAVALGAPADDGRKRRVLEHSTKRVSEMVTQE
jgi:hypothetical protein